MQPGVTSYHALLEKDEAYFQLSITRQVFFKCFQIDILKITYFEEQSVKLRRIMVCKIQNNL